jgi:hypothetical protein
MTVRINKQKINLREKLAGTEEKVSFDEVVRGLGEYTGNVGIGTTDPVNVLHVHGKADGLGYIRITDGSTGSTAADGARIGYNALGLRIQNYENTNISFFTNSSTEALTIKNNGDVGIGTTNPSRKLEVSGHLFVNNGQGIFKRNSATSAPFYAEQEGGGPAGVFLGGHVGIGTATPEQKLTVESASEDYVSKLVNTSDSPAGLSIQFTKDIANASNDFIRCFKNTSDIRFRVYSNGTVNANGTLYSSDDRVKHNEQPIVGALETLSKITPNKYIKTTEMYDADHDFELDADGNPIDDNGEPVEHRIEAGVIAQQVLTVDELAFAVSPEGVNEDGVVTSPHGLDYNSLFTYAIAAIQEQQQIIDQLKSRIETLEQQ